ncbi:amidase [Leekyejoonella antrihumi]|nr:amidase [Leekyejoonella antrihumi]
MSEQSARQVRDAVASREISAREVAEGVLSRIRAQDDELHSFLTVDEDYALAQADAVDRRLEAGEQPGPLCGVPFSVKDLYDTRGMRTTYGSRVFADRVPDADAVFVERVRRAGGVLIGKTNTPEFGIYIRTVNDLQPETVNPWDPGRTTGGSSGGAAASVAAGFTPIAIGSDGGGSVRIPAALCGLCGLKPSFGSIPQGGGSVGTRRFSAAGPITRFADDAMLLWQVMSGPHGSDPLSQPGYLPPFSTLAQRERTTPRLGWIGDSGVPGAEADVIAAVRAAAERLSDMLDTPLRSPAPSVDAARFAGDFYAIMQADRVSTGGAELMADPIRRELLTDYSRHQFANGAQISGADYSRAVETQTRAQVHLSTLLDEVDVLLTPTLGFVAPRIPSDRSALPEDARRGFVAFTFLANYTGFPAATVACGMVRGLPVGLQLVGRPGSERTLMRLCRDIQEGVFAPPVPARYAAPVS